MEMALILVVLLALAGGAFSTDYKLALCRKPKLPEHVVIIDDPGMYELNRFIHFACKKPYTLVGDTKTKCLLIPVKLPGGRILSDFLWKKFNTKCVACKHPGSPSMGSVSPTSKEVPLFSVGKMVTWKCNTGYNLDGASKATCQNNGMFDKKVPTCVIVKCKNPGAPGNGQVNPTTNLIEYTKTVTWECDEGFRRIGAESATCQADGTFDKQKPVCQRIKCKNPGAPVDGTVDPDDKIIDYGITINWSCNEGFRRKGASSATCQESGMFDKTKPECIPITCKNPGGPRFGSVKPKEEIIGYGEKIKWTCGPLFYIDGAESAHCQEDGTFSKKKPTCQLKPHCTRPVVPIIGSIKPDKKIYQIGEEVELTCMHGSIPKVAKIKCKSHKKWSHPLECELDPHVLYTK